MGGIKIALNSIGLKALQDIAPQTKTFKLFSVLSVSSILMMASHRITVFRSEHLGSEMLIESGPGLYS